MVDVDINDLAAFGLILDIPGYQLPPEAWTEAENVRIADDHVTKGPGWVEILDTGSDAPYFIQSVRTAAEEPWYLYASLSAVFAWDQSSVADISSIPYNTVNGRDWSGTTLAGTPVLTNDTDVPQYWPTLSLATPLADLPNWTADLGANSSCKVIRAFGAYLVAVNVVINGIPHPHGVLWSHPADPGSMPASWDYTDPTMDAGLNELSDSTAGVLLEALPLRNQMILYKEGSTHIMRLIGGQFIFQFDPFLISTGILAPRCVALTGDGKYHFVVTGDDIILHDGNTTTSIVDRKVRRELFNRLDTSGYLDSFVFSHPSKREMWFCYPENGSTTPTRALVWSYAAGGDAGLLYEQVFTYNGASIGDLLPDVETWDADPGTWDSDTTIWNSSTRGQVVLADANGFSLQRLDGSLYRDGSIFVGTATRTALAWDGKRRGGEPVLDFRARKFIRRVWPKVEGGPLTVRVGMTDLVGGTTTWATPQSFDPTTQMYLDFTVTGRQAPSVEFTWPDQSQARLYGYTVEIMPAGRF